MGPISAETVTRLWHERRAALLLYARQWCDTPEDVVQEAFLLLVRQAEAPQHPVSWLYRVVRNRAIKALRCGGRQARREAAVARAAQPWFEPSGADRLDATAATDALKHLPAQEREVIVARLWGGLGFEEISRLSGLSLSKVYRCYQRGLSALRQRLGVACPQKKTDAKN
jgi:RNA polymerase sigma-70 factor (ECF subfamily)